MAKTTSCFNDIHSFDRSTSLYGMAIILFVSIMLISCRTPVGCESTDKIRSESSLDSGKSKRSESTLFSKSQRNRMKKRGQ